jgi:hypothetical protein
MVATPFVVTQALKCPLHATKVMDGKKILQVDAHDNIGTGMAARDVR